MAVACSRGAPLCRIRRQSREAPRTSADGIRRSIDDPVTGDISSNDPLERLKVAIGKITGQDMASGKVVATLDCGDQAYPQMLAAIESAKFHVRLSTYIFRTDDVGLQFIDALARAHRRGVRARVLIDGFGGGFLLSSAYRRLRRQGVPVSRFLHSLLPWKMPFLNLRLHKKSLVVDGDVAFVGGLNIGGENVIARRPKAPVRDIHFRLEGPIVRQIEQEFDDDWSFATGEEPIGRVRPPPAPPLRRRRRARSPPGRTRRSISWFSSFCPRSTWRGVRSGSPRRISCRTSSSLRRSNWPFCVAWTCVSSCRAQTIILLVAWAARTHIRPLLQAGCRVWRSPPPFDHSKLMTIDGEWSLIGSANWDTRSLRLNFELTVEFYDAGLAAKLAEIIDAKCVRADHVGRNQRAAVHCEAPGCCGSAVDALYLKAV